MRNKKTSRKIYRFEAFYVMVMKEVLCADRDNKLLYRNASHVIKEAYLAACKSESFIIKINKDRIKDDLCIIKEKLCNMDISDEEIANSIGVSIELVTAKIKELL